MFILLTIDLYGILICNTNLKSPIGVKVKNMIKFLFKGLLRDKSRSLLPVIVVALGVMITVTLQAYMSGMFEDSIETTAKFSSGHVKVMTVAYRDNQSQMPNDCAILSSKETLAKLQKTYPDMIWTERIQFSGLLDAPDAAGRTRSQGNVTGMGVHLIGSTEEIDRMDLHSKLLSGRFPEKEGEALISNELFRKMNLQLGSKVTLISTTMYGEMTMYNFTICGTLHFGTQVLDRGMMIADISDIQNALDMNDAAGEILGFFKGENYQDSKARQLAKQFNAENTKKTDRFSLTMQPMSSINGMDFMIAYADNAEYIIIFIFVFAMSIVLWNAGLVGGLRRYGEFGLRMAIGENKHEIYISLVGEALSVGIVGSVVGIGLGLLIVWPLEKYGIDARTMMRNSNMMLPSIIRAHVSVVTYFIGFIPGVLSTIIGAMLAGIGVYKRQTANLFKELEG